MSYQKFVNYSSNSILDKLQIGTEYKDDIKIKKEIFRTEESGWSIYSVTNKKGFEFRVKGTFEKERVEVIFNASKKGLSLSEIFKLLKIA